MTTKSIKGMAIRLLPGQTEGVAVWEAQMAQVLEVQGAGDLCMQGGGGGGWEVSLMSVPDEPLRCYEDFVFPNYP